MSNKSKKVDSGNKELFLILGIVIGFALLAVVLIIVGDKISDDDTSSKTGEPTPTYTVEEYEANGWYDLKEKFSTGLTSEGTLDGITLGEYVTLCDYSAITVPEDTDADTYITEYLMENCEVKTCESYLETINARMHFVNEYLYTYYEEQYYEANDEYQYADIYESFEMTEEEYEASISTSAEEEMRKCLIFQSIYEKEGLSVTDEAIEAWRIDNGYSEKDYAGILYQHGENYVKCMVIEHVVMDFLLGTE